MTEKVKSATPISVDGCLRRAATASHEAGFSFAFWKLPNSTAISFAASREPLATHDVVLEEMKSGYLFAPFDPGEKKIFLPADEFFSCLNGVIQDCRGELMNQLTGRKEEQPPENKTPFYERPLESGLTADDSSYKRLVDQCRREVLSGRFEKLVPSRCKEVDLPADFDFIRLFLELGRRYPAAMVSVFSSPITGTWVGATPETLVRVDVNQHFHTVAVAGTQPYAPGTDIRGITWNQKEIEEQALVERYIINCFKRIRLREFDEHGPKTVVAGNVVHLKTDFEVDMVATRYPQLGSVMLQLLHPTSAVCGMPLEASLAFLKSHENYPRQFYSGFLGPVHIEQETQLFVNLRCMQLGRGKARLYAGAGVLGDSDPEKEWQETELKMNTLLNVIRQ